MGASLLDGLDGPCEAVLKPGLDPEIARWKMALAQRDRVKSALVVVDQAEPSVNLLGLMAPQQRSQALHTGEYSLC